MRVRKVEVEQKHLAGIAPRQRRGQVEGDARSTRPALRRVDADDGGFLEQLSPRGLDRDVGKRAEAALRDVVELLEKIVVQSAGDGVEALPVEREQVAVGLRVDRRLLRPAEDA